METDVKAIYNTQVATFLAVACFALVTIALGLLFFREVPDKNAQTVSLIVGQLLGFCSLVLGYYYGTTQSSATKDKTISSLTDHAPSGGTGGPKMTVDTPPGGGGSKVTIEPAAASPIPGSPEPISGS